MGRRRKSSSRQINIKSTETKNAVGIIAMIIASLLFLSMFIDAPAFDFIKSYFGTATFFAFTFFLNLALFMFHVEYKLTKGSSIFGQLLLVFTSSAVLHYFVDSNEAEAVAKIGEGGGLIGFEITHSYLIDFLATQGAFVILFSASLITLTFVFNLSISQVVDIFGKIFKSIGKMFSYINSKLKKPEKQVEQTESEEQKKKISEMTEEEKKQRMIGDFRKGETKPEKKPESSEEDISSDVEDASESSTADEPSSQEQKEDKNTKVVKEDILEGALINKSPNYPNWKFPDTSLLTPPKTIEKNNDNVKKNADIIEETLESFGVKARVVDVSVGPTVTQYALNIALGTKASKIVNLKTDLALALAAPTGSVRIEAPIPGTSYIGIEIPNQNRATVYIRELVESDAMKKNNMQVPGIVGKGISGKAVVTDLQKMPHILIAGATGSGKSVLMNSFIVSILMSRTPDEVRMIMVDPKQVELDYYNGIPHLLTPVITESSQVINSLKWAVVEMERRYTIFKHAKVRNIMKYNELMGFTAMPYVMIIVDELADLMMSSGAETETAIVRLAQKARATGIHLVLATQRPSTEILTGLIKANISARLGLSVATNIDSRVILDQSGAETLLGRGDLLFKEPDKTKPYRVQGVWVSSEEIKRVVKFIKAQAQEEEIEYKDEITEKQVGIDASEAEIESAAFSEDEKFADAVRTVCNAKKGSASLLQRKLRIGYNRAARLLDELHKYGIVGPPNGSKPRKMLKTDAEAILQGGNTDGSDDKNEDES